jgi:WhiB family redox-sensing transcriptional regulator
MPYAAWWQAAACQSADPELFFPVSVSGPAAEEVERAKAVCRQCPVRRECLQHAITANERYGVWGGTSEQERSTTGRRPVTRYETQLRSQS